jgi:hypothetical protein
MPLTVAIFALMLGAVGLGLDIGVAVMGVQQCQVIADAGALAGSQEMPYPTLATAEAQRTALANVPSSQSNTFTVTTAYYAKDSTVPGLGPAPYGGALRVTAAKNVRYVFLRALGLRGLTVRRTSTATKIITGTCISPMWISNATPVSYGQQINMLMADSPCLTNIPGSFGFLSPNGGVDFDTCLKGLITPEQEELQRFNEGDIVWAYTGLGVGHFRSDLKTDSDSRIKRSSNWPWSADTYLSFRADNPRIMIVPFVDYIDGTGSGARFRVRRFGAFWLEDVITNGDDRYIVGRFLDFTKPGGTGYGIKTTHLVN